MIMGKDLVVMYIGINKKLNIMSTINILIGFIILCLFALLGAKLTGKAAKQYPDSDIFPTLKILYKICAVGLLFLSFFTAFILIFEQLK